jgi:hypothetical protein
MLSMHQEQVFEYQKHIINHLLNIIKNQINNKNKQSYYNLKHGRFNSKTSWKTLEWIN